MTDTDSGMRHVCTCTKLHFQPGDASRASTTGVKMPIITFVARVSDGMLLVRGLLLSPLRHLRLVYPPRRLSPASAAGVTLAVTLT